MTEAESNPAQPKRATRNEWTTLFPAGLVITLAALQFRLVAFVLIALAAVALLASRRARGGWRLWRMCAVIAVAMFLPVDVALGSFYYGSHFGNRGHGPRLVRFNVGMPMHTRLVAKYGEYISGGCTWGAPVPPKWIWVWE